MHLAELQVADNSFAVGAFVMNHGRPEVLEQAAKLFIALLAEMVDDCDLRTGALDYGLAMSTFAANDYHASQSYKLRSEFLASIYRAAIATRERVGA